MRNYCSFRVPAFLFFYSALMIWVVTCGPGYKDISTANGRQAIIDQANDFLTAGNCDQALSVLQPLVNSQYVNNDILMIYASAYACKGGLNFTVQLLALKNMVGSDLWSPIVQTNYSTGTGDGKITNLQQAASVLRQTASPANVLTAANRAANANLYMVFLQVNIIGATIAPLGAADKTTGHRTQTICFACAKASDECNVQVGMATIIDSLNYVTASSTITSVSNALNSACQSAFGGACPTNLDMNVCNSSPALQAQGAALIVAINALWST